MFVNRFVKILPKTMLLIYLIHSISQHNVLSNNNYFIIVQMENFKSMEGACKIVYGRIPFSVKMVEFTPSLCKLWWPSPNELVLL